MSIFKRILPLILIVFLLVIIKNNVSYIINFVTSGSELEKLEENLSSEKKKNEYLKTRLAIVKNDQFVADVAQNELGMLKSGEYFVIAPTQSPQDTRTFNFDEEPNWKRWWKLFF